VSLLTSEQTAIITQELADIQKYRNRLPLFASNQIIDSDPSFTCLHDNGMRHYASLQLNFMDREFTSHRKILGPLIIFVKKKCNKMFNKLVLRVIGRQLTFNQEMCNLALLVKLQNERLDQIEQFLNSLKDRP